MTDPDLVEMIAATPYRSDGGTPLDAILNRSVDRLPGGSGTSAETDPDVGIEPRTAYVAGHDGTRLAVFLYGIQDGERRPVVWMHNRYNRGGISAQQSANWDALYPGRAADDPDGDVFLRGPFCTLVRAGYVFAVVDIRGTGSSFGTQALPFSVDEALDARAVTRWLAAQEFCTGAVGMAGRSYMGANQHFGAVDGAGVVATFPEMAPFDLYSTLYRGGVFRRQFASTWFADVDRRDRHDAAAPIGADPDAVAAARREHGGNEDLYALFSGLAHRDSVDPGTGAAPYLDNSPGCDRYGFRPARAAVHHLAGWFDPFVLDAALWFANLDGPRRLTIGPWAHSGSAGIDLGDEYVRWFDRWLRPGSANDTGGPPVRYYMLGAPTGLRWRTAETWPPPGHDVTCLFLGDGPTGTVDSVNDRRLTTASGASDGDDHYAVDPAATSGTSSRWTNVYGGPFGYGDMRARDARCLTYTSDVLEAPLETAGHPVVTLWVSSTAADVALFVYLEQVAADGVSTYVTEGTLHGSHRALSPAPYDNLGLPYHRGHSTDLRALTSRPEPLVFDLSPIAWHFPAGSRLRLSIACNDADNAPMAEQSPAPVVTVHRSSLHASHLALPVTQEPIFGRGSDGLTDTGRSAPN
jgi:putative CocE/NonD family hydrolase